MAVDVLAVRDAPLVGRDEELALVAAAMERRGCVIAGAAGVGKSRLASGAAALRGAPVIRVVASAAGASVPFAAVAHLLADARVDARGPIAACIDLLRDGATGDPPTLLVDDAHLLDDASAALVLAVCHSEVARLLVTLRRGERVPDAITALWKERRVDRLDIEPLSRRDLRALVEQHLGGPADRAVHARLFSLTDGNPLYAHELLVDARRSGALVRADAEWRWSGRPPEWSRLRDLIEARTRDLGPQGRLALELLALAAPLPLSVLTAVTSEQAVAELEHAGVAVVRGAPESAEIDLSHPLFGEVTRASVSAADARGHRRGLAAELARAEVPDSPHLVRLAGLKLEGGERDPELFLRAAAYVVQIQAGVPGSGWGGGDPSLAIRLADAAGPGLEAALVGARGRMALSRFAEVEERLGPLEPDAARAPFEQAVDYLRTRVNALHWGALGTDEPLALLERARAWHDAPDWRAVLGSLKAWILVDRCRAAGAVDAIQALTDVEELLPAVRLDGLIALGLALGRLGRTGDCEALEAEIERLADELERQGWQTGWARYMVDGLVRAEAARDLAGVADRLESARGRAEAAGDAALTAGLSMVLGRLKLLRGHGGEAIALLEDAVDGLASGDPRNGLGWALGHLTRAHALTGSPEKARDVLARLDAVAAERPNYRWLQREVDRVRAWVDAADGRLSAARERLLATADAAEQALALEGEAIYDALRFGAPPRACSERLSALAARADSDLLDACAAHAAAVATADAAAQADAAETFAGLGLDLFAAEAAAGAARAFAAQGRESSLRRANALAVKHAAVCPAARTPALTLLAGGERLTRRERDVALLAAAGASNAEIAEEMVLSVRTVETYVLRACRKLGVETRTDLASVLTPGSGG